MVRLNSCSNVFAPICFQMYLALYPVSNIALSRIFPANILKSKSNCHSLQISRPFLCPHRPDSDKGIKIDLPPKTLLCWLLSDILPPWSQPHLMHIYKIKAENSTFGATACETGWIIVLRLGWFYNVFVKDCLSSYINLKGIQDC